MAAPDPAPASPGWHPTSLTRGDALAFASTPDRCFAALYGEPSGRVYVSADAGLVWRAFGSALPEDVLAVVLLAHAGRLLAGTLGHGLRYAETDAGEAAGGAWRVGGGDLPPNAAVTALAAQGAAAFAGTQADGVFRSGDAGSTWRAFNEGLPRTGRRPAVVALAGTAQGVVAAHPYGLHRLEAGETRWRPLPASLPGDATLVGLCAPGGGETLFGWSARRVFRSSDGGATWAALPAPLADGLYVRALAAGMGGLVAGTQGTAEAVLLASPDGGLTWEACDEGLPRPSWSTHPAASGTHLLVGAGGHGVWRRPFPRAEVALAPASSLGQNDPNPFTETTVIRFVLARAGHAKVDVHDVSGAHVATLLDAEAGAGEHALVFDASRLAPDLYRYTLRADGLCQSRQMLLLR